MKTLSFPLLVAFFSQFFATTLFAQTDLHEFMTPRDLMSRDSLSNITLQNNQNSATTVYGLYVRQFGYVTPGNNCNNPTVMYSTNNNTTAGSFVTPTVINAGKSAIVGSNYLYNMIYEAIYYVNITALVPPVCSLPGCTWGNDSTIYNWCIYLGALAPVSTSAGYTSNVPPSADLASNATYNYNLVTRFVTLGPISCNDQTLTCSVTNSQTQSFP